MIINDLAKKHGFTKDVDYWQHQQSGQWILKHDAITKIANAENIKLTKIVSLFQSDICVRFLVSMELFVDDKSVREITSVGEADTTNVKQKPAYLGCIAEKRGIDRCVLKLINAYEYGISSEVEADNYKQKEKPVKQSGGMSEQDRLETIPDYSDKDEIAFTDVPAEPTIKNIINFGKHNGKDWSEVDASYVDWVANKSNVDWQREEAKKELKRRS